MSTVKKKKHENAVRFIHDQVTIVDTGTDVTIQQPSVKALTEKNGWLAAVKKEICATTFAPINNERIEQATLLFGHYVSRISSHLRNRFPGPNYWNHWCFRWARQNASRVALIVCMVGHQKNDLG